MKPSSATTGRVLRPASARRGFTLVEMMVVLAITALLSALIFSGFHSMKSGNRRVSCQSNLIAIYQAARQYQADEGAFPYYNPENTGNPGIGLWQLYTFPEAGNPDAIGALPAKMAGRYLRNATVLHCPSHNQNNDPGSTTLQSGGSFNAKYLSYQTDDGGISTYDTNRTSNTGDTGWKRQILHYSGSTLVARPPADDTIVTWCKWHRNEGGGYDNVLFYDGSVDIVKPEADLTTNWLREPRSKPTTP
jgi:prepilin-type N-terminal cleavage/methylation domain-containing protein